mgnify:CR=1 FL=1
MRVGYCYLVADIIHTGHLRHLRNCKAMCDILIAGVLTDKACMEKKPKPILSLEERVDIMSELKSVDVVVAQETYSPLPNVNAIKPDILFECAAHDEVIINPYGKTYAMPYFPGTSSTEIKLKIKNQDAKQD